MVIRKRNRGRLYPRGGSQGQSSGNGDDGWFDPTYFPPGDPVPPGHVPIGPGQPSIGGYFRESHFLDFINNIYRWCCGAHSLGTGVTCRECVENMLINSSLFPPPGPQLPTDMGEDLLDRWFRMQEIRPESGRGITPFEDSTGLRPTGGGSPGFGGV